MSHRGRHSKWARCLENFPRARRAALGVCSLFPDPAGPTRRLSIGSFQRQVSTRPGQTRDWGRAATPAVYLPHEDAGGRPPLRPRRTSPRGVSVLSFRTRGRRPPGAKRRRLQLSHLGPGRCRSYRGVGEGRNPGRKRRSNFIMSFRSGILQIASLPVDTPVAFVDFCEFLLEAYDSLSADVDGNEVI